jgi:mitogen-activated protein kinase kinase kinase 1
LKDILIGLRYLHERKIAHLDIKPDNILVSEKGEYKLADLGLARISRNENYEDIEEGDSRYLA